MSSTDHFTSIKTGSTVWRNKRDISNFQCVTKSLKHITMLNICIISFMYQPPALPPSPCSLWILRWWNSLAKLQLQISFYTWKASPGMRESFRACLHHQGCTTFPDATWFPPMFPVLQCICEWYSWRILIHFSINPWPPVAIRHEAYARFEVIIVNCVDCHILGRDTI